MSLNRFLSAKERAYWTWFRKKLVKEGCLTAEKRKMEFDIYDRVSK